jgi:outer membrane protein TolC
MSGFLTRSIVIAGVVVGIGSVDDLAHAGQQASPAPAAIDSTAIFSALMTGAQPAAQSTPPPLTLQAALTQARENSPQLRSAFTAAQLAGEDRVQARASLLPSVNGFTQYIRTEPNGTLSGVYVANDGPNVYTVQGTVHGDLFAPGRWADYRAAEAAEAVARAKADVANRGLVATVVQNYYALVAAERKLASAQQSLTEAQRFLDITQRQERAGEVAHSDVVKAQIVEAQARRDTLEAELAVKKSRLALSVIVFPDFRENFAVVDDLQAIAELPSLDTVKTQASQSNPDVKAAEASVQQESSSVVSARSGGLPSVSFDYFYGIEANQFAIYNPEHQRLLGSAAQAQMTIPLWNWGLTQSKLRQAQLRLRQAQADLTLAERQLLANVSGFHAEAQTARAQLDSLKTSLDLATESLRLMLLRYQSGEATVLEVVDAQTTLIQARNAYDDGLVRYRVALAALQTLTGTL